MTRDARDFSITITVREKKPGEKTPKIFEEVHRFDSWGDPKGEYLRPMIVRQMARAFADAVVTVMVDESIK
jgi:hypothetical protein